MYIKNFKIAELIILGCFIASVIIVSIFKVNSFEIELFVFGGVLSVAYMFFGLYFFDKPPESQSVIFSIIFGVIYSISTVSIILNVLPLVGGEYFSLISLILLIPSGLTILHKLNKNTMSKPYLVNHIIRVSVFFLFNLLFIITSLVS